MQDIIELIESLQIYDAIDELEDLGIEHPAFEKLKEEYENGPAPDFVGRFRKFVLDLNKKEEVQENAPPKENPSSINIKNTNNTQGDGNYTFQGVVQGSVNIGNPSAKPKNLTKILFMAANPKNAQSLDLNTEYRTLQQEMRQGSKRDKFEWLMPVFSTTLTEMMRGLNQQPQIIHFSGHGLNKGLLIEDENAYAQVISNEMLALLFKELKGIVQIIVLNSCYSSAQAKFLSQLGCYVVGYNTPVGDNVAQSFAKGFYLGLSDGKDFLGAVNTGRVLVMGEQPKAKLPLEIWKDGELLEL